MNKGLSETFEADSVFKILVLCVLTIGSYLIYKLYRYTEKINLHTNYKISSRFINTAIVFFTISLASLLYSLANLNDATMLRNSIGIHIVSSIFDITWILMVRKRINIISKCRKGNRLWLDPLATSIFHVVYMQYKINQGLQKAKT